MYCDAHFHIVQCSIQKGTRFVVPEGGYRACSCAHDVQEFELQCRLAAEAQADDCRCRIFSSFGMHPQMPLVQNADFLEQLLSMQAIDAIGEAGFDFFTEEFRKTESSQDTAWAIQTELAVQYNRPLIVHCRKALDRIFRDSRILRKIPSVIFHSFAGGPVEARSLLNRGINAYFSFGKPLLNGNKRSIACVKELPVEHLLLETDAPFQTLKGEVQTQPEEIRRVYAAAVKLQELESSQERSFLNQIENNFRTVYGTEPVRVIRAPLSTEVESLHTPK